MGLLGNILWAILGGFIVALFYVIGGVLLCITIIGIPFGMKAFHLAGAVLAPFDKEVKRTSEGDRGISLIFNVIWLLLFGWEIALAHIAAGVLMAITIIGLPFTRQHFKLVPLALFPFSYKLE